MNSFRKAQLFFRLLAAVLIASCGSGGSQSTLIAFNAQFEVAEDDVLTANLAVAGANQDEMMFLIVDAPSAGTVAFNPNEPGEFEYQPEPDQFGPEQFTFRAMRGDAQSNIAVVTVDITPESDAPRFEPISDYTHSEDSRAFELSLSVFDPDGEKPQITAVADDPAVASVSPTSDPDRLSIVANGLGETLVTVTADDGQYVVDESFLLTITGTQSTMVLDTASPNEHAVSIRNNGNETAHFYLRLNKQLFFRDLDNIVGTARQAAGSAPAHTAIFEFIHQSMYHEVSFTKRVWQHHPLLAINSTGFGLCDDFSSTFYHLATAAGLEARVWSLDGHVVPEVLVGDRWEVWDANKRVYYRDRNMLVAGVEELSEDPDLISNPLERLWLDGDDSGAYNSNLAAIYGSPENNFVNSHYSYPLEDLRTYITLPAGATLMLAGRFAAELPLVDGWVAVTYANLRVTVPAGSVGELRVPLALQAVTGSGVIGVHETSLEIGGADLEELVASREHLIDKVQIEDAGSGIEFVYLVNPAFVVLEHSNLVELEGINTSQLEVALEHLPVEQRLQYTLPIPHLRGIAN